MKENFDLFLIVMALLAFMQHSRTPKATEAAA